MTHVIPCPECASRIRIDDEMIGKRVRCPRCDQYFTANPNESASPVTAFADPVPEPSNPRTFPREGPSPRPELGDMSPVSTETSNWENVLVGVNLQIAGHILAIMGGIVFLGSALMLDRRSSGSSSEDRFPLVGVLLGSVLLAGNGIVSLAANSFALAAPVARGSRSLAIIGLALTILILASGFQNHTGMGLRNAATFVDSLVGGNFSIVPAMSLGSLLEIARLAVVPLFVHSLAQNMRDRITADKARFAIWCIVIVFLVTLGLELLSHLLKRDGPGKISETVISFALIFVLSVARLVMLAMGLTALLRAKTSLIRHLRAAVRAEVP
jgi:predicted Zn finger-like uncharacterized protein